MNGAIVMEGGGIPPKTWGPHLWRALHFVALGYPAVADTMTSAAYREFFTHFANVIPCSNCSNNYRRHLLELPIDRFLSGRDALFEWTVRLHNIVNAELGHKSDWTPQTAYAALLAGAHPASAQQQQQQQQQLQQQQRWSVPNAMVVIALWISVLVFVILLLRRRRA